MSFSSLNGREKGTDPFCFSYFRLCYETPETNQIYSLGNLLWRDRAVLVLARSGAVQYYPVAQWARTVPGRRNVYQCEYQDCTRDCHILPAAGSDQLRHRGSRCDSRKRSSEEGQKVKVPEAHRRPKGCAILVLYLDRNRVGNCKLAHHRRLRVRMEKGTDLFFRPFSFVLKL